MAGTLTPLRSAGAMMSVKPSPFMSATVSEFRHEPECGSPSDDFSKRMVVVFDLTSSGLNSGRIFVRYSISMSL